ALLTVVADVGQSHATGRVAIARLDGLDDVFGREVRGANHCPAAARMSAAGFAEITVAVVGADAIEGRGLERDEADRVRDVPDSLDADARLVALMIYDRVA